MESVHGVDVSWLHQPNRDRGAFLLAARLTSYTRMLRLLQNTHSVKLMSIVLLAPSAMPPRPSQRIPVLAHPRL